MIEHLSHEQIDRALKEWSRVLRPGGHLVITCPNLGWVAAQWLIASALSPILSRARSRRAYVMKMISPRSSPEPGECGEKGHCLHADQETDDWIAAASRLANKLVRLLVDTRERWGKLARV